MKKLFFLVTLIVATLVASAQNASLVMATSQINEKFFLYIDDIQMTPRNVKSIRVDDLNAGQVYRLRFIINRTEVVTDVKVFPGVNRFLIDMTARTGLFLLQYDRDIYPSYTVSMHSFQSHQPNLPGNNTPNPGDHSHNGFWGNNGGNGNHNNHGSSNVTPPVPQPLPCSTADFFAAKNLVMQETFESDRMKVAKRVVIGANMTSQQLADIARLFKFETDKLEFLKYSYSFCYDPDKYYLVNSVFTFSSSISELERYIGH